MTDLAITTHNLGKQYHIGARQKSYNRLSEQLLDAAAAPFRRAGRILRGDATGAAGLDQTMWALKDVSLQIRRGDVVGIIGRNGAGKSTLLKILSQITEPTTGYADVYGRIGSLLEVGTGFHPELTGRENIFLNGAILGMSRAEVKRKFDEIVAFAEIDEFIDTPVKHYSSGMYVRLAFSVAAHLETDTLLVDEVLAVGDVAFQRKCLGKMEDAASTGRTVLFVSHNMGLMQTLCQRGIFLEDGTVIADGDIGEAVNAYLRSLDEAGGQDLAQRSDRRGRGDVRVVRVEIYDGQGLPTTILRSGSSARFHFYLNRLVPGASCLFSVFNQFGQQLAVFETALPGPEDYREPDLGPCFICEFDELMFLPGRYRLNVMIRDGGEVQDFVEAAATFDVEAGHLRGRPMNRRKQSSVGLPHRWILPA